MSTTTRGKVTLHLIKPDLDNPGLTPAFCGEERVSWVYDPEMVNCKKCLRKALLASRDAHEEAFNKSIREKGELCRELTAAHKELKTANETISYRDLDITSGNRVIRDLRTRLNDANRKLSLLGPQEGVPQQTLQMANLRDLVREVVHEVEENKKFCEPETTRPSMHAAGQAVTEAMNKRLVSPQQVIDFIKLLGG